MPTAEEFDQLADRFDDLAVDVAVLLVEVHRSCGGDVLDGGVLTASTHLAFEEDQLLAEAVAGDLGSAARICRDRAAMIRRYQGELTEYRRERNRYDQLLDAAPDTARRRPTPPAALPVWAAT